MDAAAPPIATQAYRRRPLVWLLRAAAVAAVMLACGAIAYRFSEQRGLGTLRQEANHKLDLFAAAAQGVVRRLEHVPATIQLNPDVLAMLRAPQRQPLVDKVNAYLQRLNGHLGSMRVFVLDERGLVLASSDSPWRGDGLVGVDLAYRPYFIEALSGRVGRHFALGVHEGEPGYFVSHPIHDGARIVGVAAIKISLAAIEDTWQMLGMPALVADGNRVVILSSDPAWRYTALAPLSDEQKVDLELTGAYAGMQIQPFPIELPISLREDGPEQEGRIDIAQAGRGLNRREDLMVLGRSLDGMDWRVVVFAGLRGVQAQAMTQALLAGLLAAFASLLVVLVQQRRRIVRQKLEARQMLERANSQLERKVVLRTQALSDTNARLRQEVRERQQAEAGLRAAQDELVHAAKMAVIGQLATGITHELAQPLGGIRTLAGNAVAFMKRGEQAVATRNLELVAQLVDQMGEIIQPLKGFARKSAPVSQAVDLAQAVRNALFLFDPRLRTEQVERVDDSPGAQVQAWCDANRLQQVLINLIGNALDAMDGREARRLHLGVGQGGEAIDGSPLDGWAWVRVQDNGAGFTELQRERLFEPFFTTKAEGVGLGLGLAISRDIVREFGGDILAGSPPEGGACFLVRIPLPPESAHHAP